MGSRKAIDARAEEACRSLPYIGFDLITFSLQIIRTPPAQECCWSLNSTLSHNVTASARVIEFIITRLEAREKSQLAKPKVLTFISTHIRLIKRKHNLVIFLFFFHRRAREKGATTLFPAFDSTPIFSVSSRERVSERTSDERKEESRNFVRHSFTLCSETCCSWRCQRCWYAPREYARMENVNWSVKASRKPFSFTLNNHIEEEALKQNQMCECLPTEFPFVGVYVSGRAFWLMAPERT